MSLSYCRVMDSDDKEMVVLMTKNCNTLGKFKEHFLEYKKVVLNPEKSDDNTIGIVEQQVGYGCCRIVVFKPLLFDGKPVKEVIT